jgi:drug/metabolite transporter (DMT)-like permease
VSKEAETAVRKSAGLTVDSITSTLPKGVEVPPAPTRKIPKRAWILLLALMFCWGAMWPLIKIATAEVPVLSLRGLSALIAAAVLLGSAVVTRKGLLPIANEWKKIALCSIFLVFAWFYFSALAVSLLPAGRAALLAYTMPFFSLVIGVIFLHEKITSKRLIGVMCCLSAVLLLAWNDLQGIASQGIPVGILAILAAALIWSIGSILQKQFNFQTPVTVTLGWMLIIGGVPLSILALLLDPTEWVFTASNQALLATLAIAVLSQAFGFWCWSTILKLTDVAFASIAVLCVPMMSQAMSFILVGEAFGLVEFVGLLLITLGLATVLPLNGLKTALKMNQGHTATN